MIRGAEIFFLPRSRNWWQISELWIFILLLTFKQGKIIDRGNILDKLRLLGYGISLLVLLITSLYCFVVRIVLYFFRLVCSEACTQAKRSKTVFFNCQLHPKRIFGCKLSALPIRIQDCLTFIISIYNYVFCGINYVPVQSMHFMGEYDPPLFSEDSILPAHAFVWELVTWTPNSPE